MSTHGLLGEYTLKHPCIVEFGLKAGEYQKRKVEKIQFYLNGIHYDASCFVLEETILKLRKSHELMMEAVRQEQQAMHLKVNPEWEKLCSFADRIIAKIDHQFLMKQEEMFIKWLQDTFFPAEESAVATSVDAGSNFQITSNRFFQLHHEDKRGIFFFLQNSWLKEG